MPNSLPLSESDKAKLGKPGFVYVHPIGGYSNEAPRVAHWSETTDLGTERGDVLDHPEGVDMVADHMKATAPPIVRTSGVSKAERLMELFLAEVRVREQHLGRPLQLQDFSDQWLQALRLDILVRDGMDLSVTTVLTADVLRRVAEYYCQEEGNKAKHHKGQIVSHGATGVVTS